MITFFIELDIRLFGEQLELARQLKAEHWPGWHCRFFFGAQRLHHMPLKFWSPTLGPMRKQLTFAIHLASIQWPREKMDMQTTCHMQYSYSPKCSKNRKLVQMCPFPWQNHDTNRFEAVKTHDPPSETMTMQSRLHTSMIKFMNLKVLAQNIKDIWSVFVPSSAHG